MGMFDYLLCEMPLPAGPQPPADTVFQTKDVPTHQLYMERWFIKADGRLIHEARDYAWQPDETKEGIERLYGALKTVETREVEHAFHGDIEFYHLDDLHEWWEFSARFTEGRCTSIRLAEHRPPSRAWVQVEVARGTPPTEIIAAMKEAGFRFFPGCDQPDNVALDGRHLREDEADLVRYRMVVPLATGSA